MKPYICLALTISILFSALLLPTRADETPTLTLTQTAQSEPGQDVTLILSLPVAQIAGGCMRFSYDACQQKCSLSLLRCSALPSFGLPRLIFLNMEVLEWVGHLTR